MKFANLIKHTIFASCLTLCLAACSSDDEISQAREPINVADFDTKSGEIIGVDRNSDVEISYVHPRFIEDYETRTIGEALTGDEHTHGYLTFRSQPDSREGMYFFIMLDWAADEISTGCTVTLDVDSTNTAKTRSFTFRVPETSSVLREIKIGITGSDWNGKKENANAWKVVIKTPAGKIVAQKQSWLWSLKNNDTLDKQ